MARKAPKDSNRIRGNSFPPGLIAMPVKDMMPTRSAEAVFRMYERAPAGTALRFFHGHDTIESKRDRAVRHMLERSDLDWLLFVDSDMLPPSDYIPRLLSHGGDRDIIAGLCFARRPPHLPAAGWYRTESNGFSPLDPDYYEGGLVEVTFLGTACMLIRRRTLENREERPFRPRAETEPNAGEDFRFCARAAADGFRLWCDTGLDVGHLGLVSIGRDYAEHYYGSADFAERYESMRTSRET